MKRRRNRRIDFRGFFEGFQQKEIAENILPGVAYPLLNWNHYAY